MRGEREVERALAELRAPGEEEAEERAWDLIRRAQAERIPVRSPTTGRRLTLAAVGGLALLAIVLSPAGAKVGNAIENVFGIGEENAKPRLRSLPAAGELLVESEQGPWIVREDGSKRLLGDYDNAAWSPHGLYVTVSAGRELAAVDTQGTVRWTFPAPGVVHDPRWGGDATDTRIAYRSGDDLRVIAGDGSPGSDRLIARDVAPTAPAWRPIGYSKLAGSPFVLTYRMRDGQIRAVDAETGDAVAVLPSDRRRLDGSVSPDGSTVARLEHTRGSDRLVVDRAGAASEVLFSARSRLSGPTWSPDGDWLLIGWPAADQWLFIDAERPRDVVAFGQISEQFDPGGRGRASFPSVSDWILPER